MPFATIGDEFGAPEGDIGCALVIKTNAHTATFAFGHIPLGLGCILITADAAGSSCAVVGVHGSSHSLEVLWCQVESKERAVVEKKGQEAVTVFSRAREV